MCGLPDPFCEQLEQAGASQRDEVQGRDAGGRRHDPGQLRKPPSLQGHRVVRRSHQTGLEERNKTEK